ncbi:hypothetical protein P9112_000093 [Eukaryota sp. TZLM1-RC]
MNAVAESLLEHLNDPLPSLWKFHPPSLLSQASFVVQQLISSSNSYHQVLAVKIAILCQSLVELPPSIDPITAAVYHLSHSSPERALIALPPSECPKVLFLKSISFALLNNHSNALHHSLPLLSSSPSPSCYALVSLLLSTPTSSLDLLSPSYSQSIPIIQKGISLYPDDVILHVIAALTWSRIGSPSKVSYHLHTLISSLQKLSPGSPPFSISFSSHPSLPYINDISVTLPSLPSPLQSTIALILTVAAICFTYLHQYQDAAVCAQSAGTLIPGFAPALLLSARVLASEEINEELSSLDALYGVGVLDCENLEVALYLLKIWFEGLREVKEADLIYLENELAFIINNLKNCKSKSFWRILSPGLLGECYELMARVTELSGDKKRSEEYKQLSVEVFLNTPIISYEIIDFLHLIK